MTMKLAVDDVFVVSDILEVGSQWRIISPLQ